MKEMTATELRDLAQNGVPEGTHVSTHFMSDAERNLFFTAVASRQVKYPLTIGMSADLHLILQSARFDQKALKTLYGCEYVYAILGLLIDPAQGYNVQPRLLDECRHKITVSAMVPANPQNAKDMTTWGLTLIGDIGKPNGFAFDPDRAGIMRFRPNHA